MLVSDFITELKPIIKKKAGNENYDDIELYGYLKSVYVQLQKDKPIFTKFIILKTVKDEMTYTLDEEVSDVTFLSTAGSEYKKQRIDNFHKIYASQISNEPIFSIDLNQVYLYPKPSATDMDIDLSANILKEITGEFDTAVFEVPLMLRESLRLLFLSRAFEKIPNKVIDKTYVDLSLHYLKRYKQEIEEVKKASKIRHRNVKSNFQRF